MNKKMLILAISLFSLFAQNASFASFPSPDTSLIQVESSMGQFKFSMSAEGFEDEFGSTDGKAINIHYYLDPKTSVYVGRLASGDAKLYTFYGELELPDSPPEPARIIGMNQIEGNQIGINFQSKGNYVDGLRFNYRLGLTTVDYQFYENVETQIAPTFSSDNLIDETSIGAHGALGFGFRVNKWIEVGGQYSIYSFESESEYFPDSINLTLSYMSLSLSVHI